MSDQPDVELVQGGAPCTGRHQVQHVVDGHQREDEVAVVVLLRGVAVAMTVDGGEGGSEKARFRWLDAAR